MFDWFKNLFKNKDFDEYSKNEKTSQNIPIVTPQPTQPSIPTNPSPIRGNAPIVRGSSGTSGTMSGLPGLPGNIGITGSPGFTGYSHSSGFIVCGDCFAIFKPSMKTGLCPDCTARVREEKIKKLLEE